MRIGYDAKRLFLNQSGLGNYSRTLVQTMHRQFPDDELHLFTPRVDVNARTQPFIEADYRVVKPKRTPKALHSWWRSVKLASVAGQQNIDIFHGLSHELPPGLHKYKIPSVVTIHDLIFLKFPSYYPRIDRSIYKKKVKTACALADRIVAISQRTALDLIDLLDIPANRIEVIYQGCDPIFHRMPTQEEIKTPRQKFNLQRPYIVAVGTIEHRKNQVNLVRAFAKAELHKSTDLVLVGRQTNYTKDVIKEAAALGVDSSLKLFDKVAFNDLPALMKGAEAMTYVSRYEGFGLPVLEAMTIGVPVIAASGSCLEEVGGAAAQYAAPDDIDSLSSLMQAVTGDAALRGKMIENGLDRAKRFDSDAMAKSYHQLYEQLR